MNTREEFGKYVLLKKLAEDPLGETFRAGRVGSRGLEQVVLLRVLNGPGLDAEKLWSVLSGRKEVQSALKSPNIGSGVDAGRVRGVPYVAYDYVSGKDLATLSAQAAREGSPFPTDHALLIADRIGLALTAAYETRHGGERVLHGMVVPHLVMISNEGETRLLGFEAGPGLAAQAPSLPPEVQRYLAPEVRTGAPPGKGSDVFSLGAILFEILTGKPLPTAPAGEYTTLLTQARLASEGTPLPQPVAALLTKSLAAPDSRLPDPASWHKALSRILSEGGFNATTFNLAFFMHNLFRDEIEEESKEIEAEKTLDVPATGEASVAPAGAETVKISREEARRAAAPAAAAPPDDTSAVKARYGMEEEAEGSKKGLWIGLAAAAVVLAALGAGIFLGFIPLPGFGGEEPEPQEQLAEARPPAPPPEPAPPEPTGPSPEELQAQIDAMFEERAEAMEANFKAEADKRIAELQRQLDQAQEASEERARRLEEARREAQEAAEAAAEEEEPEEPAGGPAGGEQTGDRTAAKTGTAGQQGDDGETAAPAPQPQPQPVTPQPVAPPPPPPPPEPPPEPQVKRGQLVNPGPGVSAPRLVRRAAPTYPSAAARLNREATVDVRVLVDETGEVIEAEIDGRKAGLGFDEAALQAARSSRFEPPTKFDVPVKMWTTMRFVFKR